MQTIVRVFLLDLKLAKSFFTAWGPVTVTQRSSYLPALTDISPDHKLSVTRLTRLIFVVHLQFAFIIFQNFYASSVLCLTLAFAPWRSIQEYWYYQNLLTLLRDACWEVISSNSFLHSYSRIERKIFAKSASPTEPHQAVAPPTVPRFQMYPYIWNETCTKLDFLAGFYIIGMVNVHQNLSCTKPLREMSRLKVANIQTLENQSSCLDIKKAGTFLEGYKSHIFD